MTADEPLFDLPLVAFCVPVMGRLDELKQTLEWNLQVVASSGLDVRIVVASFDSDSASFEWVEANFAAYLNSGHLHIHQFQALPFWHRSRAKNAFRTCAPAEYYSSLDANEFLTSQELEALVGLLRRAERQYLVHLSNSSHDASAGRLTFPWEMLLQGPYLTELLPHQFHDAAVVLRLLSEQPGLDFVTAPSTNLLEESAFCRQFVEWNDLRVRHSTCDFGPGFARCLASCRHNTALDLSERGYYFRQLNACYAMYRLSIRENVKELFRKQLSVVQDVYCRTAPSKDLEGVFDGIGLQRLRRESAFTLYACVKDDHSFLDEWLNHYRRLGIERFIIVDDYSTPPLASSLEGSDVFVVRPLFGTFKIGKPFWLRLLMGAFQTERTWVVTADSDEFMDVPKSEPRNSTASPLASIVERAEGEGTSEFAALLLDMMPDAQARGVTADDVTDVMTWHFLRPPSKALGYQDLAPVRWAFGPYWFLSFSVDIRFSLHGTIDCLRKVPLFKFDRGVRLDKGFHALYRRGSEVPLRKLLRPDFGLLPMRHFKLAKFLSRDGEFGAPLSNIDQYHDQTQSNLQAAATVDAEEVMQWWSRTPFKHLYSVSDFPYFPCFPRTLAESASQISQLTTTVHAPTHATGQPGLTGETLTHQSSTNRRVGKGARSLVRSLRSGIAQWLPRVVRLLSAFLFLGRSASRRYVRLLRDVRRPRDATMLTVAMRQEPNKLRIAYRHQLIARRFSGPERRRHGGTTPTGEFRQSHG